jgi:hypothetical protein
LPQDFMDRYGFEVDGKTGALPKHAQIYRHCEPQYLQRNMANDPILVEQAGFYSIVKLHEHYYPFTSKTGHHDLLTLSEEERQKMLRAPTLDLARVFAFQNA